MKDIYNFFTKKLNNKFQISIFILVSIIIFCGIFSNYFIDFTRLSVQIAFFIIFVVIAFGVVNLITKNILRPVNELNNKVAHIADGDLTQKIKIYSEDEIGILGNNINNMTKNFGDIVSTITIATGEITGLSHNINNIMVETSSGIQDTTNQMSSINTEVQKVTESMHNVTFAVEQVSESTFIVAESCSKASEKGYVTVNSALEGGKALDAAEISMNNMINSMENVSNAINTLNESSKRINDIVGVISSISDQTNLLALNAAIEAARAGEHGLGFSVVAEEIKKLAEQSNRSANEIKDIIGLTLKNTKESVEALDIGHKSIDEEKEKFGALRNHFNDIIDNTQGMALSIESIASIAQEQSAQTEEIDSAVKNINNLVNSTSLSMESVTSTSREQTAMLQELQSTIEKTTSIVNNFNNIVRKFKI